MVTDAWCFFAARALGHWRPAPYHTVPLVAGWGQSLGYAFDRNLVGGCRIRLTHEGGRQLSATEDSVRKTEFIPLERTKPRSRARRILFPLLALTLALVTACGAVELGLRICGYGRNYTNPMGSFLSLTATSATTARRTLSGRFRRHKLNVLVEHDEKGFRRGELPRDQATRNNVYVLGDSFVWGYGVGQDDLLTNQMQRRL